MGSPAFSPRARRCGLLRLCPATIGFPAWASSSHSSGCPAPPLLGFALS